MKSKTASPRPKKKSTAKLKTQPNEASVAEFLDGIADERRRKDSYSVLALMKKLTKTEPRMWGGAIVGFGDRRFEYASGRSGDWFLIGFSPRKAALVLYGLQPHESLLKSLGKHERGGGCLYIRNLEEIDSPTLTTLIKNTLVRLDKTRGEGALGG